VATAFRPTLLTAHARAFAARLQLEELPAGWTSGIDQGSGQTYYYNEATGASQWEPPQASTQPLPAGWTSGMDEASGATYYFNENTGEAQWDPPVGDVISASGGSGVLALVDSGNMPLVLAGIAALVLFGVGGNTIEQEVVSIEREVVSEIQAVERMLTPQQVDLVLAIVFGYVISLFVGRKTD